MTVAVVIGATRGDSPWLADLLPTLDGCRWPVVVHLTRGFELATIGWAAEWFDEYVFLPESSRVLDLTVFDRCFGDHAGVSVSLGRAQGGEFRMYLGKYLAASVRALGVPSVGSKEEAVQYEGGAWCGRYREREEAARRFARVGGPMEHTNEFVERHGRVNMIVRNEHLERWKGSWDWQSMTDAAARIAAGRI